MPALWPQCAGKVELHAGSDEAVVSQSVVRFIDADVREPLSLYSLGRQHPESSTGEVKSGRAFGCP
eukprot:5618867-Prymnesium_polylepis.2